MFYKIKFKLRTQIAFTDLPLFDSLLAWCYMKEKNGTVEQKLSYTEEELEDFSELPLIKEKDYFLGSFMFYDETNSTEQTTSWKKRWDNVHDEIVDFGKSKRKVDISRGQFKSYDMPLVINHIPEVWFFFASENVKQVEHLLRHLVGIGKKISQGFGEINIFEIEALDYNPFEKIIRPIPAKDNFLGIKNVKFMGYRPPYWLPDNQTLCYYQD